MSDFLVFKLNDTVSKFCFIFVIEANRVLVVEGCQLALEHTRLLALVPWALAWRREVSRCRPLKHWRHRPWFLLGKTDNKQRNTCVMWKVSCTHSGEKQRWIMRVMGHVLFCSHMWTEVNNGVREWARRVSGQQHPGRGISGRKAWRQMG